MRYSHSIYTTVRPSSKSRIGVRSTAVISYGVTPLRIGLRHWAFIALADNVMDRVVIEIKRYFIAILSRLKLWVDVFLQYDTHHSEMFCRVYK